MELTLDFAKDDSVAGFRLSHFELYNWGTFNKSILRLDLAGNNGLLTGDIGSGKSTIVDALTTLLVPHQKIIYNKAAGANTKERTLSSYILGEYKSSQDENFKNSKAIALRDNSNFTVLLAKFVNEGFNETLTLAQFFYITQNQVNKFFVVSKDELSIQKDFFHFNDIRDLKKRLRKRSHTEVFDVFKEYSKSFRRTMGIKNEQALNLFYQTVSLKSIGNLTEFIRTHMLEPSFVDEQIDELCSNFADLSHTHDLVVKAREQIELLKPIDNEGKRYDKLLKDIQKFQDLSSALPLFLAGFTKDLLEAKLKELEIELIKSNSSKKILEKELEELSATIVDLKIELEKNGGDRLNQIENSIRHTSLHLENTKKENENFNQLIKKLGFPAVSNEHRFLLTHDDLQTSYHTIDTDITKTENSIMLDNNSLSTYKAKKEELDIEIVFLENNPTNIPGKVAKMRDIMAKSLGLKREDLPFVGELITVTDQKWSGAIERVLHNFALSLIVESSLYEKVSSYVESTNLQGRLVYLKVKKELSKQDFADTVPNSLLTKIELKVDSPFFQWVENELVQRFNIACVEDLEQFRRFKKALTISGQFKSNLTRHEKDDRYDIDDKSRWVLGWDNLEKLQKFQEDRQRLEEKIIFLHNTIEKSVQQKQKLTEKRDTLRDALKVDDFETINWYRHSKIIEELQDEKKSLEHSNDVIQSLQNTIAQQQVSEKEKKSKLERLTEDIGRVKSIIATREEDLASALLLLENNSLEDHLKKELVKLKEEHITTKLNLNTLLQSSKILKEEIDKGYKSSLDKKERVVQNIQKQMSQYTSSYPVESQEFDASIDSLEEFRNRLLKLKKDNLPQWEKRFKELLKEKTIQGIVMLKSNLEEQSKEIIKKIDTINLSLQDIEYSQGTYIELLAEKSNIKDIKDFKEDLKSVTSGSINVDNNYDEQKFLQIKQIIDRLKGREGFIDVDKKWRKTVTDVRNWFDFSASEKYMSDGMQKEYYAHSGGKSGGQKEKLAYTVLASSLAYQFGLEYEKVQSRSFRFVMIDEAFGRGSDESTRYALRLFEKLKLQLLVITPKQKINVIEPFVSSVHFTHNQDGMDSTLISMDIKEYQKKKKV